LPTFLRRAIIPHEQIHDDLGDMRVIHDAASDAELTASIRDHGIRNPVTLRPHPKIVEEYQLIDGRRRLRCNESAGHNSILAEIYEMTDLEACLDALEKNIQRDDPDPVGLGFWLERIMKEDPTIKTQEDLARIPSISRHFRTLNSQKDRQELSAPRPMRYVKESSTSQALQENPLRLGR